MVFTMNSAPAVSADGRSWNINATFIPSTTDSVFVYKGPQSFQAQPEDSSTIIGAMVTTYAPVSLFIDDVCYYYYEDSYGNLYVSDFFYC